MKRNPNFLLSDVVDSHILVPLGKATADFNGIITLNDMGVVIWNLLEQDTTEEELLQAILAEYEVGEAQARADITAFLEVLRASGCLEE